MCPCPFSLVDVSLWDMNYTTHNSMSHVNRSVMSNGGCRILSSALCVVVTTFTRTPNYLVETTTTRHTRWILVNFGSILHTERRSHQTRKYIGCGGPSFSTRSPSLCLLHKHWGPDLFMISINTHTHTTCTCSHPHPGVHTLRRKKLLEWHGHTQTNRQGLKPTLHHPNDCRLLVGGVMMQWRNEWRLNLNSYFPWFIIPMLMGQKGVTLQSKTCDS